VMDFR